MDRELLHLVHSIDDFLTIFVVLASLVHDLDCCHISVVLRVNLKLHIIRNQEIHELKFLLGGQLAENECLRLLLRRHIRRYVLSHTPSTVKICAAKLPVVESVLSKRWVRIFCKVIALL